MSASAIYARTVFLPRSFLLALAVLLAIPFLLFRPEHNGDAVEYTLATVALAEHGTPDIRLEDIAIARRLAPERAEPYDKLERDIRDGKETLYAAFTRGLDGKVYAVHFFGYSALAVVPYKLLELAGLPPFKCYQAVNLAALFVLGLSLWRLFGSASKAGFGMALFMLCGGVLYWNWSSPECLSAAALLAGLILYTGGMPVWGCALAGLAAQQNPTILFFFGFAPLLQLCIERRAGDNPAAALRRALGLRQLAGLALGLLLLALPPLFNLWTFGVPNIIVKLYSNPTYVGLTRLHSFFFDLNQGMLIGVPALLAMLCAWGWRGADRPRAAAVLLVCLLFTLALAVPALAVLNWNSGAVGVMRYAFWAAMPFVFALLWRLRQAPRWPRGFCATLLLAQAVWMASALSYSYVTFSPLARAVLRLAPRLYHPEPEIFAERAGNHDNYINSALVYQYPKQGEPVKRLYNRAHPGVEAALCGDGMELAPESSVTDTYRNWSYIDGPLRCQREDENTLHLRVAEFGRQPALLAEGWSAPENGGGSWNGVWSVGGVSQLRVDLPARLRKRTLTISGHYFDGNTRTRVKMDGEDLGWMRLDQLTPIDLSENKPLGASVLLELAHEAPRRPNAQDTRELAFFLQEVTVR